MTISCKWNLKTKCSFNKICALWVWVEDKCLVIIQVGNAKRDPALHTVLELVPIAGFEVHEKEIALSAKYVVYMIPVIEIIKRITGITAGKRDVPGFRGIVGREEIRSPMRQANTLLSCEIKTIWS